MLRALLALVALAALALAGLHPPAMAMAAAQPPQAMTMAAAQPPQAMTMAAAAGAPAAIEAPAEGMDCHAAAGKSALPDKPVKAPGCCPEGQCDGHCAPVAALLANATRPNPPMLRAALEAPALAAAPSAAPDGLDRPPRRRA